MTLSSFCHCKCNTAGCCITRMNSVATVSRWSSFNLAACFLVMLFTGFVVIFSFIPLFWVMRHLSFTWSRLSRHSLYHSSLFMPCHSGSGVFICLVGLRSCHLRKVKSSSCYDLWVMYLLELGLWVCCFAPKVQWLVPFLEWEDPRRQAHFWHLWKWTAQEQLVAR